MGKRDPNCPICRRIGTREAVEDAIERSKSQTEKWTPKRPAREGGK